jgi:DNA-binding LytR/AlgR family response regulator
MIKAIAIDDEPLALNIINSFCSRYDFISLEKTFTEPKEALKYLQNFQIDLVFADIQMPSISGLKLAETIEQNVMIIFTTAFSEYAVKSYELNAIDYLLKPINPKRFEQAINKANEYYNYLQKKDSSNEQYIFVRADYSLVKIPLDDILYIEGLADYLRIFIQDRKPVVARMTMKDMLEKLPSNDFIRVHRSYILPFSRIEAIRNNTIILAADIQIPIGKTYVEDFFKKYNC